MKIAVCLSGQPRSIEYCIPSLLDFFRDTKENTFDFFCHSWDYNTWKTLTDTNQTQHEKYIKVDRPWLEKQIQRLNPAHYAIEGTESISAYRAYKASVWSSLFYSAMMANHYKKKYEAANNFTYDCVIRSRFDVIFHPNRQFNPLGIMDRTLYHPHVERAITEYHFLNASDPFFYGDSWAMDIVSDVFRNLERDCINMLRGDNPNILGPGALMSYYCKERNVQHLVDKTNNYGETIYRKEMLGKDPIKDFPEILKTHRSYYGI